jgi:hypothetical protein
VIKELLYKWFNLEPFPCPTCQVLMEQLARSERERHDLLQTVLIRDKPQEIVQTATADELKPVMPQYVPWRVKQQMYEAEDRRKAELMRAKQKEMSETKTPVSESVAKLEEELGIKEA